MKKMTMILGALLLVAVASSSALAYRGGGLGTDGGMATRLNLTAEQTSQIKEMREAFVKELVPLQNKLYAKRNELKLLWLQKTPDQEKITAVNKEVRALRGEMEDKMTGQRLAVTKILTPEQQAKLQSYGGGRGYGQKGGRGACDPVSGRGPAYGPRGNW